MRTTSPASQGTSLALVLAFALAFAIALAAAVASASAVALTAATSGSAAGGPPRTGSIGTPDRATYQTVLGAYVPSLSKEYGFRAGRMRSGRLANVSTQFPTAQVRVKGIDGSWRRDSVRFVDVSGTARSLQLKVSNIVQPGEACCCGTADALFVLTKGKGARPVVRNVGYFTERATAAAAWRAIFTRNAKAMAGLLTPPAQRQATSDPRIAVLRRSTRLTTALTCRANAADPASGRRVCEAQRGAVRLVLNRTGFARWRVSGITVRS